MRAEDLVTLAAAHGVDLVQAARLAAPGARCDTISRRGANGRPYSVLVAPSDQRANGHASRSHDRPTWSLAELGQAAAGVPRLPFLAACYSYAGDSSVYWELWEALYFTALRLRTQHHWPAQVPGVAGTRDHFYLEQLAQLVLDEDAHSASVSYRANFVSNLCKRRRTDLAPEHFRALRPGAPALPGLDR